MGLIQNLFDRFITQPVAERLTEKLQSTAIEKSSGDPTPSDFQQFERPLGWNDQMFQKKKPDTQVTYRQLRNLSQLHDVSRACINIRKREITQLEWDITSVDDANADKFKKDIPTVKAFFQTIGGYNVKMRKLLDILVEDYLVIDGVSLYRRRTRKGDFLGLLPIDPSTIKIRVTEAGTTPMPPEAAYEQWINGSKVADFTADEMIYDMLNPRSNTAYGFSVIEALVLAIDAALRSAMYSVSYFTDGNVPEGFFGLPENYTVEQIKTFQDNFDALLAGDPRMQNRIKFMPSGGSGFTPSKAFSFDQMKQYNEWLMRITASLFGVMPSELGFTESVNKSSSVEQSEIAKRISVKPMAVAIEQLFNEILQKEKLALTDAAGNVTGTIGPFPELRFAFLGIDTRDDLVDSEISERMIKVGALSVDEWRKDQGKEPIGLDHYIMTAAGPILLKDVLNPPELPKTAEVPAKQTDSESSASATDQSQALETTPLEELDKWERKAIKDIKDGRSFRKFESKVLDAFTLINIGHEINDCLTETDVKKLFKGYKTAAKIGLLKDAERLAKNLEAIGSE